MNTDKKITGRYTFRNTTPTKVQADSKFRTIARSLHAQGINFETAQEGKDVLMTFEKPVQRLTTVHRKPSRPSILPPILTLEQTRRRLAEARQQRKNLFRNRLKRSYTSDPVSSEQANYWLRAQKQRKALGAWIAKDKRGTNAVAWTRKRFKSDYAGLKKILYETVTRSKYPLKSKQTFYEYLEKATKRTYNNAPFSQAFRHDPLGSKHDYQEINLAYGDVQYWEEMVRLATEREQPKTAAA